MSINHRLMYTGSQDGTAKCWVTEFGDNTVTYKGHTMTVTVIKFYKGLGKYVTFFQKLFVLYYGSFFPRLILVQVSEPVSKKGMKRTSRTTLSQFSS